jgi:hypothetical protein
VPSDSLDRRSPDTCCSTASANPYVAHPGNRATTLHCGITHGACKWSRSPAGRVNPTNPEGRRVSHEYLSTPEACKGRDAPFSALALHTDPGKSTHFPAPRTGRGAALGLRHKAPVRIFTFPLTQRAFVFAHHVCRTPRSAAGLHGLPQPRLLHLVVIRCPLHWVRSPVKRSRPAQ